MENFKEWIEDKYTKIVDNQISASSVRLTEEQEKALFEAIYTGNDMARGLVFLIYQRCIDSVLSRNSSKLNGRLERQEYLDEGVDIVLDSIKNFDNTKGVRFITYLTRNLENLIERVNRRNNMHVRSINQKTVSIFEQVDSDTSKNEKPLSFSESLSSGDYEENERKFQSEYLVDKLLEFVPHRNRDILLKNYGIGCDKELSFEAISNLPEYKGKIKRSQTTSLGKNALLKTQDLYRKITKIYRQTLLGKNASQIANDYNMTKEEVVFYLKAYNYIFNGVGTKPVKENKKIRVM